MALCMVAEACFDPVVAAHVWSNGDEAVHADMDVDGGSDNSRGGSSDGGGVAELMSNHPSYGSRHQRLVALLPEVLGASAPERCQHKEDAAGFWHMLRSLLPAQG